MIRLPRPARWLLRWSPVAREMRAEVLGDLQELFEERRRHRGALHAHWRLYRDLASLWRQPHPTAGDPRPRSALALLSDAGIDLRYAVRLFARQPAILLLTILGLSLGLGIATAAFSIVNVAALRGEGLVDPGRAPGVLRTTERSVSTTWTYDEFLRLREGSTRMQVEAVLTESAVTRTGTADPAASPAGVAFVSSGFFAATGARTMMGRPLGAVDDQLSGPPPVVVSFLFWTSRLNRDPAAVGRTMRIGRTEATIVGVAERGFSLPNSRLLWMPLTAYGPVYEAAAIRRAPETGVQVFGRLLPGAGLSEAEAQLAGVAAALPGGRMAGDSALMVRLDSHAGLGRLPALDTLMVTSLVFAVIALVLLLACANVATVLISTAITRDREMGVRAALGASRGRIVRQLVTESLALGTVAAAIGLVFAWWAIPIIGTMIEAPAGTDLAPDLRVYLFLGFVTLLTGVGAGLAPAWHSRGVDLVTPLKGAGPRPYRVAPRRIRFALVMTQSAAGVLLIVLATLLMRATFRTAAIDVGFEAGGLYAVAPGLGDAFDKGRGAAIRDFWARVIPELRAIPGITAVTLAEMTPFEGTTRTAITHEEPPRIVYFNRTQAGYFETIGLRLLAGRTYGANEVAARAPVALISQSLARAYWHGQSPLGQPLPPDIPLSSLADLGLSGTRPVIIGVVADAITARLHERGVLAVYEPLDPPSERFAELLIRATPDTGAITLASQRLRSIDPQADVRITSVADRLRQESDRPRMLAIIAGVVGLIAIVLCVIGLYGLTASLVGQRAGEMGVRAALGAEPRDLLRLLMWDSLRPVVLGLAIGAGAALVASRLIAADVLFGVSPQDPAAFAGAAASLLAAAVLAVLVPTRRASTVDAASVLRRA